MPVQYRLRFPSSQFNHYLDFGCGGIYLAEIGDRVSHIDMDAVEYSARRDLLSRERTYRILDGVLFVTEQGETVTSFPLESVTDVFLKYHASQRCPEFYTATVFYRGGALVITSSSFSTLGEFENRGEQYAAFIRALHDGLLPFAHAVRFRGGIGMPLYLLYAGILLLSVVLLGWIFFFLPAEYVTDLVWVKISIMLMLLWLSVRFMRKNRPVRYSPADIPPSLLP